ncbi:hypothetical protein [Nocardia caishijiensis]|uniref:Uncharacterized protein n=1 Tax=Nocardia caishijiensis TaxID=184756 RepID=A0ABQ6YGA2_9NOCA|nr:hypothetical protein [Nocardia caishijiensis]KAF0844823.1 hypothetical protein FNL39_11055 [Nocardia caishijiensis]
MSSSDAIHRRRASSASLDAHDETGFARPPAHRAADALAAALVDDPSDTTDSNS